MKTALLLLSLLLIAPSLRAEDAAVSTESQATEAAAAAERQKKLQAEEQAKSKLEKKPVTYSGFLHDASRAQDKKKFFSLRQPRDPKNDAKNISYDERTERPRGFVLFRIGF
ncbi:MAG TPA: hypothetical protein VF773_17915 [Verrucomicrobiae bacterium]